MQTKTFANAPVFSAFQDFAVVVQTGSKSDIVDALRAMYENPIFAGKSKTLACMDKFFKVLLTNEPQWQIFALGGNSKLPFVSFSTLPGVTCPGAGECLSFCYSFTSWRYPDAFFKQAQNAYLMRANGFAIRDAFQAIAAKPKFKNGFDFRLYVDGDFASAGHVRLWMNLIREVPNCRAYGYSKSFAELLKYDAESGSDWPANYVLNMSSGHNADKVTEALTQALPIVRGSFTAVNVGYKPTHSQYGTHEHDSKVRAAHFEATGRKAFVCPGQCGTCTPKGHACGSKRFQNVDIILAVH